MDTIKRTELKLVVSGDDRRGYLIHDAEGILIAGFSNKNSANRFAYDASRKAMDPKPWILPATMERFAEEQPGFCVYSPRIVWPEHGGRMVRRDYLRAGDRAISGHYGERTVKSVRLGGTEGQTTTIIWVTPEGVGMPFSESYDSDSKIELLTQSA